MAAFSGARIRPLGLPAGTAAVRQGGSPMLSPGGQALRRPAVHLRPTGMLMAAILAATMLGLVYLTQTLGSNATHSEIGDLVSRREELGRQLRNLAVAVETYADAEEIGRRARKLGLIELGDVIVLAAP
jgi:hypothetical protein